MKSAPRLKSVLSLLWATIAILIASSAGFSADVVIDPSTTFQTIEGWGAGGGIPTRQSGVDAVNYQLLDTLIDDLGLTGSRWWEVGPRTDGTGIDGLVTVNGQTVGDCDVIDWSKFQFAPSVLPYLLYYSNRIKNNGYQPSFYSSPGYPTHATDMKPWVLNHPGERALQLWANALWWKNNYGINVNYGVIYNEPSTAYISPALLAEHVKAVGPRFAAQGLTTKVQFAEGVTPGVDWGTYIAPELNDPIMWPYVGRLSYHNYGSADYYYRPALRDFGNARTIQRGQTEMGDPNFDDLYFDLTLGGVSYWEVGYATSTYLPLQPGGTTFTRGSKYFRLRQLLHFVRPGAVRLSSTSSDPSIRVLSFAQNGKITTIIENIGSSAQTVSLNGLPPGIYGLCQSTGNPTQELGLQTVGASGTLTINNVQGGSCATTLYPYSGPNHAPQITTFTVTPTFIEPPATTATLSATATDAELDPLTYQWSVVSQPAGANATLASPNSLNCNVSNLTVAGVYEFNINVSDGINVSSKQVYLNVFGSNQPPSMSMLGFRIGAPYGLVFDPTLATHAYVNMPFPGATLQAQVGDLENDTLSGQWSIVSQPAGSNLSLVNQQYIYLSFRADISNLTLPGDYVFNFVGGDPTHPTVLNGQITLTVRPAASAPVCNSISANPATLTLPANSTQLTASTSDPQGQLLRHWWVVKSSPAGFNPVFDHQGLPVTNVSGLNLPGVYTFTVRIFNDTLMTTRDVSVTVNPTPGAPVINSPMAQICVMGAPFSYTITATNSPTSFNATNLPPGLSYSNGKITGTPTVPGTTNIALSATNASGTGNGNLALTVNFPAPIITSPLVVDGLANNAFLYSIVATNVPTSYTATGLPAGLVLNGTSGGAGVIAGLNIISGTPTAAGTTTVTITATNASGTDTKTLTIIIYSAAPATPTITSALSASGTQGNPFSYQTTASNSPTRFFAVGLPAGLSINPNTGLISGVPSVSGTFNVKLEAGNLGGTGAPSTLVLTIGSGSIPPSITAQPANATVNVGQTATFTVSASGTAPLSYQWTKNGSNIAGATATSYITPPTVQGDNGALFAVVVSNSAGSVMSNNATLTVNPAAVPPSINTQPANATVNAGQTATFTVVAGGTAPLNYQWTKNGTSIAGATSASYTTPPTVPTDNGAVFVVVVSNSVGSVTSNNATLTVNNVTPVITSAAAANPNPTQINQSVAFSAAASDTDGDTLSYTWSFGDGASANGNSVAHTYTTAGTYTATVTVSDGISSASSSVTVTVIGVGDPSLVGYWKFDEGSGTAAVDSSTYANNGSINGTSWTTGKIGAALSFNGSNNYVNVPNSASLNPDQVTVSAWINTNNLNPTNQQFIIAKQNSVSRAFAFKIVAGRIQFYATSGSTNVGAWGGTVLQTNVWYHVAGTYDGATMKIYVSGALDATQSGVLPSGWDNALNVTIGGMANVSWPVYFSGLIDEVRMYKRILSASEIQTLAGSQAQSSAPAPTASAQTSDPVASGGSSASTTDPITMSISKLQGTVHFSGANQDSATVSGILPGLASPFDPKGQTIALDIGGAAANFTLDSKGHAKSSQGAFALKLKRGTAHGTYQGGNVGFIAKIQNGSWVTAWNLDPTLTSKNALMSIAVTIILADGSTYTANVNAIYTSKAKVGGKFVKK